MRLNLQLLSREVNHTYCKRVVYNFKSCVVLPPNNRFRLSCDGVTRGNHFSFSSMILSQSFVIASLNLTISLFTLVSLSEIQTDLTNRGNPNESILTISPIQDTKATQSNSGIHRSISSHFGIRSHAEDAESAY